MEWRMLEFDRHSSITVGEVSNYGQASIENERATMTRQLEKKIKKSLRSYLATCLFVVK
jgi:hypothetical protein